MRLLIDADSAIYKAGCSNETREYMIQDKETGIVFHSCQYKVEALQIMDGDPTLEAVQVKTAGPLAHSLSNAKRWVETILDLVPFKEYQLYIGGKGNFRYDLYPAYKGTRDPNSRPIHEQEIREYLIKNWHAELVDGEEADDVVSYKCCEDIHNNTIVGIDKDLWTTPGWHLNPDKGIHEFITEEQANRAFWTQMLTGDTSDNIPCLKGIGPKGAEKILDSTDPAEGYDTVVHRKYMELGYDDAYFNLMGQLLWLRRKPNQVWEPSLCV